MKLLRPRSESLTPQSQRRRKIKIKKTLRLLRTWKRTSSVWMTYLLLVRFRMVSLPSRLATVSPCWKIRPLKSSSSLRLSLSTPRPRFRLFPPIRCLRLLRHQQPQLPAQSQPQPPTQPQPEPPAPSQPPAQPRPIPPTPSKSQPSTQSHSQSLTPSQQRAQLQLLTPELFSPTQSEKQPLVESFLASVASAVAKIQAPPKRLQKEAPSVVPPRKATAPQKPPSGSRKKHR